MHGADSAQALALGLELVRGMGAGIDVLRLGCERVSARMVLWGGKYLAVGLDRRGWESGICFKSTWALRDV